MVSKWENIIRIKQNIGRNRTAAHIALFLFLFLSLVIILSFKFLPSAPLKVGEVSPKDIEAPQTAEILDEEATREAKIKAANIMPTVYSMDFNRITDSDNKMTSAFETLRKIQANKTLENEKAAALLKTKLPNTLSEKSLGILLSLNPATLSQVEIICKHILSRVMGKEIKEENIDTAKKEVTELAKSISMPESLRVAVVELTQGALQPNMTADIAETTKRQQEKMQSVNDVKNVIVKGQIIVRKGDIITPKHLAALQAIGIFRANINLPGLAGISLLTLTIIILILAYLALYQPSILRSTKLLFLLALIIVLTTAMSEFLPTISGSGYWAPVAAASMLIAILLDFRLALLTTGILGILVGMITGEINYAVVALITGFVAVFSVSHVSKWSQLIWAGVLVFLANILAIFAFSLVKGEEPLVMLYNCFVYGAINGVTSGLLAIGLLPVLENFFGITTHIKLLEISNPSEPLMQRLLVEAPGTYHHSVIVANLAEGAAYAVGADSLLARVGAYYHDIGKIKRPYFFVENQLGGDNPHDKVNPSLSTLIITSHVKDGMELAKQYHLPQPIIDMITEHHGTSLVSYFYHQAILSKKEDFSEEDFRYDGPKPQSKETAIVMLADAIEAASRSLQSPNPNKLENMARRIVKEILSDGQLDECDLSFRNISDIVDSFVKTLNRMFHTRIEYPEKIETEMIKQARGGKIFTLPKKEI